MGLSHKQEKPVHQVRYSYYVCFTWFQILECFKKQTNKAWKKIAVGRFS